MSITSDRVDPREVDQATEGRVVRDEPAGPDTRLVAGLQERAARAIPAVVEDRDRGWWLRYGDSDTTWWAGATLAHGSTGAGAVEDGIDAAERFYARFGAVARFQVCPACPPTLDQALARRGYARHDLLSVQVRAEPPRAIQRRPSSATATVQTEPDPEWLALWSAAVGGGVDAEAEWRLLQRVRLPSAYVTLAIGGRPVSVGRAVAERGWTGVFQLATVPDTRGQGAASAVLSTLADWAERQRTPRMYLQVERNHPAAQAVYRRAGFREICTYHYRTGDTDVARLGGSG
jgi:GNAT superfamily N-acetyltransferase